ncbi:MAG: hypothetical protein PHY43_09455 [Verrucomicrobiales bacterium]|nr:hypothetical protein [Verrucomicrobiales bacterium]
MNRDEAKNILLLYRHGTADADDPQIAAALALAERDTELKDWLVMHCARQFVLREKFRQITAPAGLKEQIISEQLASERRILMRQKIQFAAAAAIILLFGALVVFWFPHRADDDTLDIYQNQMAGVALRGYAMDVVTNDPAVIRAYLAQHDAPADFILPEKLKQVSLAGCAVEGWQGVKVSMICFRSSQAAPDVSSDIWLFVVDRTSLKKSSAGPAPQFSKVNRLMTATWIQGDKLYFLGTTGDEQTIQQYL